MGKMKCALKQLIALSLVFILIVGMLNTKAFFTYAEGENTELSDDTVITAQTIADTAAIEAEDATSEATATEGNQVDSSTDNVNEAIQSTTDIANPNADSQIGTSDDQLSGVGDLKESSPVTNPNPADEAATVGESAVSGVDPTPSDTSASTETPPPSEPTTEETSPPVEEIAPPVAETPDLSQLISEIKNALSQFNITLTSITSALTTANNDATSAKKTADSFTSQINSATSTVSAAKSAIDKAKKAGAASTEVNKAMASYNTANSALTAAKNAQTKAKNDATSIANQVTSQKATLTSLNKTYQELQTEFTTATTANDANALESLWSTLNPAQSSSPLNTATSLLSAAQTSTKTAANAKAVATAVTNNISKANNDAKTAKTVADKAYDLTLVKASATISSVKSSNGTYRVTVTIKQAPSGVKQVRVPIWQDSKQADIIWYTATKQKNGTYTVDFNANRHQFRTGSYNTHVYVYANNGKSTTLVLPKTKLTPTKNLSISNSKETTYQAKLSLPTLAKGQKVTYSVWVMSGKKKIQKWINAKTSGTTSTASISIKDFKVAGTYHVEAYLVDTNGKKYAMTSKTFVVHSPTAKITLKNVNKNAGKFQVSLKLATIPSGVKQVLVPIWSQKNQSDIYWYPATKQKDGSYLVTFDFSRHNYNNGTYSIHSYVDMNNGLRTMVGATSIAITANDIVVQKSVGLGKVQVTLYNSSHPNTTEVLFPTWSTTNGQDDINWYGARKSGNAWTATIEASNHAHPGDFLTHVYARNKNGLKYLNQTKFQFPAEAFAHPLWNAAYGPTYIQVSIGQQHMWYFVDGQLKFEADVVTGKPDGHDTPKGHHKILYKQSPTVLVGADYRTPVSYWMPFTWEGHGFHDATWQPWFGGNRYTYAGSHGCVNMELGQAGQLYGMVSAGTDVYITD